MTWYNEIDPFAARWLRELQAGGLIERGEIDERRIETIETLEEPRAHFFAGIGGWDYALRLAGWPVDRPVWTGSCPCQPFSVAGEALNQRDRRHLWPAWFRLIRECHPDTIFGEQVAGAIRYGWFDRVCADLEAEGYTCGAAVLGAHSIGTPHVRQRLYWVADSTSKRREKSQERVWVKSAKPDKKSWSWHGRDVAESRLQQVAYGVPYSVEMLRAYGNAIVPQVAAAFVRAYMEEAL